MSKNTETEDRLTAEWEPEVKFKRCGIFKRVFTRKVVTRGIVRRKLDRDLKWMVEEMRKGNEVRFTMDGEDALRFVPITDKEFDHIGLKSQTMGSLVNKLSDLAIKVFKRNGKKITKSEALEETNERFEEGEKALEVIAHITPDMMATCPNCGTRFRIGKQLK